MSWLYKKDIEDIHNPFNAWLNYSDEDDVINKYFIENIKKYDLFNGSKKILDIGCSSGRKSLFFINELNNNSIDFTYYALDPFKNQLELFEKESKSKNINNIVYINSELEYFNTDEKFDLIIVCHSLYYVNDIKKSLSKLLDLGKELLLFHQGEKGVNIIHDKFKEYLKQRPYINLNDYQIYSILKNEFDKTVELNKLIGKVDVSECSDINSKIGHSLISFFLETNYYDIPENIRLEIHSFFKENFPKILDNDFSAIYLKS